MIIPACIINLLFFKNSMGTLAFSYYSFKNHILNTNSKPFIYTKTQSWDKNCPQLKTIIKQWDLICDLVCETLDVSKSPGTHMT